MFKSVAIGNLTSDAKLSESNGRPVANFTVAAHTTARDSTTGEYITNFIRVGVWGNLAQTCARLTKGQRVAVTGNQSVRTFTRQDGTSGFDISLVADSVEFLSPAPQKSSLDSDLGI